MRAAWIIALVGLTAGLAGPAWAQDRVDEIPYEDEGYLPSGDAGDPSVSDGGESDIRGRLSAQGFLVDGKTIGGVVLGGAAGMFRFDLGLNFAWATDERAKATIDGDGFFGMVLDFHVGARFDLAKSLAIEVGSGLDVWWLLAIHEEEAKYGLPLIAAVEGTLGDQLFARLEGRGYPLRSGGLMVGRSWEGEDTVPFFLTASAGVWF